MIIAFKKMFLAGTLITALAGSSDSTTNQNTKSLSETMVTFPIENNATSTDNKELTFNEKMKKYKATQDIKDIAWSESTERYVYIKETGIDKFDVYLGDYKLKKEEAVISHNYNSQDSSVSMSPKGDYFLITRLKDVNPDRYNSELYYTLDKKKYFTLFSISKPYWDQDGKLIRSTEYIDKYPTTYQSLISVDTFKSVPSDNDPFEETVNVVTGKKYEKTKVVFYIEDVEDNVIVYAETDLDTDSSIQKEVKY